MNAVVDNDIVLKGVCYGLIDEILSPWYPAGSVGVLGAARFVISDALRKIGLTSGPELALGRLGTFLEVATTLEPTEDEQFLAADFELAAQRAGVALDTGESHLCALAIRRSIPALLTGDKRAIIALEVLVDADQRLLPLSGAVWCLEQLIGRALEAGSASGLRAAICAEPLVDKTLTICFSCAGIGDADDCAQGLMSYIRDLRRIAVRLLAP